jgi:type II secretory pathway pseudopilin PulG
MKMRSSLQRNIIASRSEFPSCDQHAQTAFSNRVSSRFTRSSAFTLVEALVGIVILGVVVLALCAGINSGIFAIRLARENLRATQVMLEKMEIIRLLTWEQLNSPNIMPTKFTAPYDEKATNGLVYQGKIEIDPVGSKDLDVDYLDDLRMVTVEISWKSGNLDRSRKVMSYVSRYGLQNYVFN